MKFLKLRGVWLLLFLAGAAIRAVDVARPADGRVRESWRECDYAAIARNFDREGMNILRPRIDWRGTGPGFAEMEIPAIPWAMAALYRIFGIHEEIGRILMGLVSLASMLVFFALARRLLPPRGAIPASVFFVLSPLAVRVSNSLQPEGLMFLFILTGVLYFLRWLDEGRLSSYMVSLAATAGAILVKAPAAHIGILLAGLLLWKKGIRAFRRLDVWAFGLLALLPAAIWFVHAHRYFLDYGLSLGVSNETHWFGLDLLRAPRVLASLLAGLVRMEGLHVWTPVGLAALGVVLFHRRRDETRTILLWWLGAIGIYCLAAIRTLGDGWALYYHVVAVPPAALTIGAAADRLSERLRFSRPGIGSRLFVGTACLLLFGFQGFMLFRDFRPRAYMPLFGCVESFKPLIPEGALILAAGGPSRDETGRPCAFNAPYVFYWLDRKGWNIPSDRMSLESVLDFARKGARYFVAERSLVSLTPGFEDSLRRTFLVLEECPEAVLFFIQP